jgi:hypothetical protein
MQFNTVLCMAGIPNLRRYRKWIGSKSGRSCKEWSRKKVVPSTETGLWSQFSSSRIIHSTLSQCWFLNVVGVLLFALSHLTSACGFSTSLTDPCPRAENIIVLLLYFFWSPKKSWRTATRSNQIRNKANMEMA